MTDLNEMKDLIKLYSTVRNKFRELNEDEKVQATIDYINKDFKDDVAILTEKAIKVYSYLGYDKFIEVLSNVKSLVDTYNQLDRYSF